MTQPTPKQRCGFVSLVGRPNVGKSSLLNRLLGEPISITSRKPQTTRHTLLGIRTEQVDTLGSVQTIYIDTPGLHQDTPKALNRLMNRSALRATQAVDLILFLVEGLN